MPWIRSQYITLPAAGQDSKSRQGSSPGEPTEPRCDFAPRHSTLTTISPGIRAATIWRRSTYGQTLTEIKKNDTVLYSLVIPKMTEFIKSILGPEPDQESYVIVSPPKRRHPGKENYASRLCAQVAANLRLTYIDDYATCATRQRINPDFTQRQPTPTQKSIIVIDDILTTGSTLTAMHALITASRRNPILFAAILNRQ